MYRIEHLAMLSPCANMYDTKPVVLQSSVASSVVLKGCYLCNKRVYEMSSPLDKKSKVTCDYY